MLLSVRPESSSDARIYFGLISGLFSEERAKKSILRSVTVELSRCSSVGVSEDSTPVCEFGLVRLASKFKTIPSRRSAGIEDVEVAGKCRTGGQSIFRKVEVVDILRARSGCGLDGRITDVKAVQYAV